MTNDDRFLDDQGRPVDENGDFVHRPVEDDPTLWEWLHRTLTVEDLNRALAGGELPFVSKNGARRINAGNLKNWLDENYPSLESVVATLDPDLPSSALLASPASRVRSPCRRGWPSGCTTTSPATPVATTPAHLCSLGAPEPAAPSRRHWTGRARGMRSRSTATTSSARSRQPVCRSVPKVYPGSASMTSGTRTRRCW